MPVNVKSVKPCFARPAELGPVDEVPQPLHSNSEVPEGRDSFGAS